MNYDAIVILICVSNTMSESYPEYDLVVIGAGHNGLTFAGYLAKIDWAY